MSLYETTENYLVNKHKNVRPLTIVGRPNYLLVFLYLDLFIHISGSHFRFS